MRAMLHFADGAVPVVHVVHAETVRDATARESHESRMQVGERLHQVGAEVFETLVGGAWFERDEVKVDGARLGECQA